MCLLQKVGDSMVDSVLSDNIPVLTEQEKFNETITSSIKRLEASIIGQTPLLSRCSIRVDEFLNLLHMHV